MGQPAARIGDMTAHGGVILKGNPTVLIGGMPAACVLDMHVCPMATPGVPPIPHVGGPIAKGSLGVLIGGMPAARMGDIATCVGPPDVIASGCMNVLIGDLMPGGGGGGGGGSPAVAAAHASAATAQTANTESTTAIEHWLEFKFTDKSGNPVSGIPYKLLDSGNNESRGILLTDGKIRRDAIQSGNAKVQLYYIHNVKWSKDSIKIGEDLKLQADSEGFDDGIPALFQIFKRDINDPDIIIENIKCEVKNNKIEAGWIYELQSDSENKTQEQESNPKFSSPVFYFDVSVENLKSTSNIISVSDDIEIELKDGKKEPIADEDYILILSSGEIRKGKTDSSGCIKESDVAPGECEIMFPNLEE